MATFRCHGDRQSTFAPVTTEVFSNPSVETMSSVLAFKAEQNPRSKFLLVASGNPAVLYTAGEGGITEPLIKSLASVSAVNDLLTSADSGVVANSLELYRDLGKTVYLKLTGGYNVAVLRLVQRVNGVMTNGVPVDPIEQKPYYVLTWVSAPDVGDGVKVKRTG